MFIIVIGYYNLFYQYLYFTLQELKEINLKNLILRLLLTG
jgi:hypothetical protein